MFVERLRLYYEQEHDESLDVELTQEPHERAQYLII